MRRTDVLPRVTFWQGQKRHELEVIPQKGLATHPDGGVLPGSVWVVAEEGRTFGAIVLTSPSEFATPELDHDRGEWTAFRIAAGIQKILRDPDPWGDRPDVAMLTND